MTQAASTPFIETWYVDPKAEDAMSDGHAPIWRHLIGLVPETDLSGLTVLDFGCNQGGFLRMLHTMRPFRRALGIDIMELGMLRALEAEGIEVVDGAQALLDAREIKTGDEIELLKMAAAMVDATYVDIARAIRPGTRENELVAIANDRLFRMGSERVECVNSVSGRRGRPHSHTFSDRMIQPGDMIFLDIMHSYNGYRTCYYRTFICGEPNKHQIDAYETASKWISASIDMIKPGVTPDEVAAVWPDAHEFGYRDEEEAFLLQYGHGVGLSQWGAKAMADKGIAAPEILAFYYRGAEIAVLP